MIEENDSQRLGMVVSGSLTRGVEVRLDSPASIEEMAVGRYVTIEGKERRFFGMITDISLGVTDQRLTLAPPDVSDPFVAEVLSGTSTYGMLHVLPSPADAYHRRWSYRAYRGTPAGQDCSESFFAG